MSIVTPVTVSLNRVPANLANQYVDRLTKPLEEITADTKALQSYDINWAYTFNPLRLYPMVKINDGEVICPMLPLLLNRVTEGIYFDLVAKKRDFLGISFQEYVGDVISAANKSGNIKLLAEKRYGSRSKRKDSIDWIAYDESATLFLECKSNRMCFQGKSDMKHPNIVEGEISKLADFVVQSYITLSHALSGQYTHWKPNSNPIYVMIVTMDEWHIFGKFAEQMLEKAIFEHLEKKGIDKSIVNENPYQICSIHDFETLIQILEKRNIDTFMRKKTAPETRSWPIHNSMVQFANDEKLDTEFLFPSDMDLISMKSLRS